jgi:hypothetical protein
LEIEAWDFFGIWILDFGFWDSNPARLRGEFVLRRAAISFTLGFPEFSHSTFYSLTLTMPSMKRTKPLAGSRPKSSAISSLQSSRQRWGRRLAEDVDRVLTRHPQADPEDVRLTLISLKSSPLNRLNRSLRRGRGFAAFRK